MSATPTSEHDLLASRVAGDAFAHPPATAASVARIVGRSTTGPAFALVHGAHAFTHGAETAVLAIQRGEVRTLGAFDVEILDLALVPERSPLGFDQLVALGFGGELLGFDGVHWKKRVPASLAGLQKLAMLDGELYGLGVNGRLARLDHGSWVPIDVSTTAWLQGALSTTEARYVFGDTFVSELAGERAVFPQHIEIAAVAALPDDDLLVAGWDGQLLRGKGTHWREVRPIDRHRPAYYGIARYRDETLVASGGGIFRVGEDDTLVPVSRRISFGLTTAGDQLWSRGVHDLERYDGKTWSRVEIPESSGIRTVL